MFETGADTDVVLLGIGFPNRLLDARAAKGWTQGQVAAAAGMTRESYNRLEGGKKARTRRTTLEALAKALSVEVEHLEKVRHERFLKPPPPLRVQDGIPPNLVNVGINFGKRLLDLRVGKDWSQQELAEQLTPPRTRQTIANLELRRTLPSRSTFRSLVAVFDVEPIALYGFAAEIRLWDSLKQIKKE